jgi:hypothetical protein
LTKITSKDIIQLTIRLNVKGVRKNGIAKYTKSLG